MCVRVCLAIFGLVVMCVFMRVCVGSWVHTCVARTCSCVRACVRVCVGYLLLCVCIFLDLICLRSMFIFIFCVCAYLHGCVPAHVNVYVCARVRLSVIFLVNVRRLLRQPVSKSGGQIRCETAWEKIASGTLSSRGSISVARRAVGRGGGGCLI